METSESFFDDFADVLERTHGRKLRVERIARPGGPTHGLRIYQKRLRGRRRICVAATTFSASGEPEWYSFYPKDEDTSTLISKVVEQLDILQYRIGIRVQIPASGSDRHVKPTLI